jgi:hypothetical protein
MGQVHAGQAGHVGHWGRLEHPLYPEYAGHPYRLAGSEAAGRPIRTVTEDAETGRSPLLGVPRPGLHGPVSRPAWRSIPLQRDPETAAATGSAGLAEPDRADGPARPDPLDPDPPDPERAAAPRPIAVAPTPESWHSTHGRTLSASEPFRWLREYPPGMFDWLFRRGPHLRG